MEMEEEDGEDSRIGVVVGDEEREERGRAVRDVMGTKVDEGFKR
jgi:hypothetical protein